MIYQCTEPPLLYSVQHFLDRCYKSRYISRKLNIRELLERSDCSIFRKAFRTNSPLVRILPETYFTNYALRKPCFYHPTVATERFKSSGAPNGNFRENICSEDDLRSRIFGAFVVKFLACPLLLGFSNIYKMV